MDEKTTVDENQPVTPSNNNDHESSTNQTDNSQLGAEPTSIPNDTIESSEIPTINQPSDNMSHPMSRGSIHGNHPNANLSRPNSNISPRSSTTHAQFMSHSNQFDTQAQLVAFTQPLMSIPLSYQPTQIRQRNYQSPRTHTFNEPALVPSKSKSKTVASQPEYYVDSFQSNFSDKPSSNSNNNKSKIKHVTFQEPDMTNESSRINSNNTVFTPTSPSNGWNYPLPNWIPPTPMYSNPSPYNQYNYPQDDYYYYNGYYPPYSNMMMNPRLTPRPRGMNMMSSPPVWTPTTTYYTNPQVTYAPHLPRPKQLYDPYRPKLPSKTESHDSSQVLRQIVPKHKKKTKQSSSNDNSTVSTPEPISHPITILRKPSTDSEIRTSSVVDQPAMASEKQEETIASSEEQQPQATTSSDIPSSEAQSTANVSTEEQLTTVESSEIPQTSTEDQSESNSIVPFPSHELLSILQSANCISSLNEYAQQKKIPLNYEFSSTSPSSFTCTISINRRQFPTSSPSASKTEAQKLACDQAVRILYRESCPIEQSSLEFSSKHDYIAHRSISTFHDLNVNELLLGRKTLACMLMITDQQFAQARVISIATGNSCLDETNLSYADDGTTLHDCHAEILARRGLIKYLFEQIKQSKDQQSSIFEYNSTTNKYQLRDRITFHMYISSLPCGNASLNMPSNSIRYKQGQTEGTLIASTSSIKYPIKSCSDKIYRWNILGIQGGLLINLLTKPIYLQTITIACETTFDRTRVNYTLCERFREHLRSLPSPFVLHTPDIDCPETKSFQQERQVAKLQTNAFAWNITEPSRTELLEPMTGKLKNDRSISSLSKQNLYKDFLTLHPENSLTYHQAKQLDPTYIAVKDLISAAFQSESSNENISWRSKSDQLEQFSNE